MKARKTLSIIMMLALCMFVIAACNSGTADSNGSDEPSNTEGDSNEAAENWAEANGIFDNETDEELYEKAKEEGEVIVYSKGSKFKKVKTTFEEKYPGIKIEPYKLERGEMEQKLMREHDAGVYNADLVHVSALENLVERGYIHPYRPADIMENFAEGYKDDEHPVQYFTINTLFYNSDINDEPPIDNWWDLTDPEWKGKILIQDPVSDLTLTEHFVAMIKDADGMATAYKDKYGEEIELTEENAAYEFFARFIANDPVLMSSSEDILDSVADSTKDNERIGFGSSSKARHIEESGMSVLPVYDMNPKVSHLKSSTLYIADHAPHPNAAKLLARYVLGGTDGDSGGLEHFNEMGTWIPRTDVENFNPVAAEDLNVWTHDQQFYDANFEEFRNFWISRID